MELLHDSLPPTLSDLNFDIVAASLGTDDLAPEGLGGRIGGYLADFPEPWMAPQSVHGKSSACAGAAVPLQYEELLHPLALRSRDEGWSNECDASVFRANQCDVRVEPFVLSMPLQVVTVLGFGICILRPNVGKLVLVELQQLLQRRVVFWSCFAEFERHGLWRRLPNV